MNWKYTLQWKKWEKIFDDNNFNSKINIINDLRNKIGGIMKVVVDASNVAHHVKNENSQPQMVNILAAVKALEESEDEWHKIIADSRYNLYPVALSQLFSLRT